MKKIFLLTVLCLLAVLNVGAQEAYARFNSDNGTLTFYYDNNKASGDYGMNNAGQVPAWSAVKGSVVYVEFAESFASYRPIVTDYWFQGMSELRGIRYLSNLNTEEVTSMGYMFDGCKTLGRGSFSLVLSSFKTDKVTNMQSMFKDCAMLPDIDFSSFNTSNVTTVDRMFSGCVALKDLNLCSFDTRKVTCTDFMFEGCKYLKTIYVGDLWDMSKVSSSVGMFKDCESLEGCNGTKYDASHTDKQYAVIDNAPDQKGYLSPYTGYVVYDMMTLSLTFYGDGKRSEWEAQAAGDGMVAVYDLNTGQDEPGWKDDEIFFVTFDPSFATCRPMSTWDWFYDKADLEEIEGIEYLNTSRTSVMGRMFYGCKSLASIDVSRFNTQNVWNMSGMFQDCTSLTEFTGEQNFDTHNVTMIDQMFYNCSKLTSLDLSRFDLTQVTDPKFMLSRCTALKTVVLPRYLLRIGSGMFRYDTEIEDIYYWGINLIEGWATTDRNSNTYPNFKPDKQTRFHVPQQMLVRYRNKFYDANVTFVGEEYGTDNRPLEIYTEGDWHLFREAVYWLAGEAVTARLMNDLTVNEGIGSSQEPFVGCFDGNGHTLTLGADFAAGHYLSLFQYMKNATIKNLKVNGILKATMHSGGLVSFVLAGGSSLIQNCRVSTELQFQGEPNLNNNNVSETGFVGGVVGHAYSATLTFEGCFFDGRIDKHELSQGEVKYAGALLGWCDSYTNIHFKNCMEKGRYIRCSFSAFAIYHKGGGQGGSITANMENTYACARWSTSVTVSYIKSGTENLVVSFDGSPSSSYDVSTIKVFPNGMETAGVMYGINEKTVSIRLTCPENYTISNLKVDYGTLTGTSNPYSLTMDKIFEATITATITAQEWEGNGTRFAPWLIKTCAQMDMLAARVNAGNSYQGKYFRLDNDLTYDKTKENNYTPIGNINANFSGHFDGCGHVVSGIHINKPNAKNIAVFGQVKDAEISRLILADSYLCGKTVVAGVVGVVLCSTVSDVHVLNNVTISGTDVGALIGGVAAEVFQSASQSLVTFCSSGAKLVKPAGNSTTGNYVGGVVGITYWGAAQVTNCLYFGNEMAESPHRAAITNYITPERSKDNFYTSDAFSDAVGKLMFKDQEDPDIEKIRQILTRRNEQVFALCDHTDLSGISVGVCGRTLSAIDNGDGTWTSKAYTVCLPFDLDLMDRYNDIKVYRLYAIKNNREFVFTNDFPHLTAGNAYLVVMEKGTLELKADNVEVLFEPGEGQPVYDYNDENVTLGTWRGTFRKIDHIEADPLLAYGMQSDGRWKRYRNIYPNSWIGTYRALFCASSLTGNNVYLQAPFYIPNQAGDEDVETELFDCENFEAASDIPDEETTVESVLHTIDRDGTERYFDLNGRQLSGKPQHGIFIYNGKKVIK